MTMKDNHIAWMKNEAKNLKANIANIEAGKARFGSSHDGGPLRDVTDTVLADSKRSLAELEKLLKEYD